MEARLESNDAQKWVLGGGVWELPTGSMESFLTLKIHSQVSCARAAGRAQTVIQSQQIAIRFMVVETEKGADPRGTAPVESAGNENAVRESLSTFRVQAKLVDARRQTRKV